ncbi:hypothetical protein PDE_00636 [Penicillium oxalicum 114-2]|uniref:Uncharacterized protein n=1 Tax=Penicillium oxalicum (strain 114-2 / CGMCC 5302) TaxID=933388 RepID=S8AV18_PENO1|nr:hypothetical protein PDE_00636 [Penicillium oxalicum 114-2]
MGVPGPKPILRLTNEVVERPFKHPRAPGHRSDGETFDRVQSKSRDEAGEEPQSRVGRCSATPSVLKDMEPMLVTAALASMVIPGEVKEQGHIAWKLQASSYRGSPSRALPWEASAGANGCTPFDPQRGSHLNSSGIECRGRSNSISPISSGHSRQGPK